MHAIIVIEPLLVLKPSFSVSGSLFFLTNIVTFGLQKLKLWNTWSPTVYTETFKYQRGYFLFGERMHETVKEANIVKDKKMGGAARLEGTRVRVMDIVKKYEILNYSPEEISQAFDVSVKDVFEALSYYQDHAEEVRSEIREQKNFVEKYKLSAET